MLLLESYIKHLNDIHLFMYYQSKYFRSNTLSQTAHTTWLRYMYSCHDVNSNINKRSIHPTINSILSDYSNHTYTFSWSLQSVAHTSTCHKSHHIWGFRELYGTLGQKEYTRQVTIIWQCGIDGRVYWSFGDIAVHISTYISVMLYVQSVTEYLTWNILIDNT